MNRKLGIALLTTLAIATLATLRQAPASEYDVFVTSVGVTALILWA